MGDAERTVSPILTIDYGSSSPCSLPVRLLDNYLSYLKKKKPSSRSAVRLQTHQRVSRWCIICFKLAEPHTFLCLSCSNGSSLRGRNQHIHFYHLHRQYQQVEAIVLHHSQFDNWNPNLMKPEKSFLLSKHIFLQHIKIISLIFMIQYLMLLQVTMQYT